jgi:hypothetical protein
VLHIVCDRDVGLFNLILGVIPHTHWALTEGRIPIIYYGEKNCYWTPNGYRGRNKLIRNLAQMHAENPRHQVPAADALGHAPVLLVMGLLLIGSQACRSPKFRRSETISSVASRLSA